MKPQEHSRIGVDGKVTPGPQRDIASMSLTELDAAIVASCAYSNALEQCMGSLKAEIKRRKKPGSIVPAPRQQRGTPGH